MARIGKVFISYRREDSDESAGRIRDWLTRSRHLSASDIFMDIYDIMPGTYFKQKIEETIQQCQTMLVIIGPNWFAQPKSPSPYIHQEIVLALKYRLRVIPVLVRGARMPAADELPEDIRTLAALNASRVRPDDDFEYDMRRLANALGIRASSGMGAAAGRMSPRPWIVAISVIVLVALGIGALNVLPPGHPALPLLARFSATATPNARLAGWRVIKQAYPVAAGMGLTTTLSCPKGQVTLGGGFSAFPGFEAYTNTPSNTTPQDWEIHGSNSTNVNSSVNVYAICVDAAAASSRDVVSQSDTLEGGARKEINLMCPANKVVTGGGYSGFLGLAVWQSSPDEANASSYEFSPQNGVATVGTVTAYAICLDADEAPGQVVSLQMYSVSPKANLAAQLKCTDGQVAVGGGYYIDPGFQVDASYPSVDSTNPSGSWSLSGRNIRDVPLSVYNYVVCVAI